MSTERKYAIDSGWVVSTTDECTCGMAGIAEYGHESFCGIEQECPVEEFDNWVKHMLATQASALIRDQVRELTERDMLIVEHARARVVMQEQIDYLRSTADHREAKGRTNAAFDLRTKTGGLLWTRYDEATRTSTVYVPLDAAMEIVQGSQTVVQNDPEVSSEKPPMTLGEYLDAVGDGDAMLSSGER